MSNNPYPHNTIRWRAYEEGRADTNDKWRKAWAGKLAATRPIAVGE